MIRTRAHYQFAWTLGGSADANRMKCLAQLAKRDAKSKWMRAAVASSLMEGAGEVFAMLATEPAPDLQPFLEQLAEQIGAKHDENEVKAVVAAMKARPDPFALARARGRCKPWRAQDRVPEWLGDVITQAKSVALDANAKPADRTAAIPLLSYAGDEDQLLTLLADRSPAVQLAALHALDRADASNIAPRIVASWPKFSPAAAK